MSSLATIEAVLEATEPAAEGGGGSGLFLILLFMLPLAFLFFTMRKQRSQQRSVIEKQQGLQIGDEVMTTTGLYATIVDSDDKIVLLEAAPGVHLRWDRRAVLPKEPDPAVTPNEPPAEGDDTPRTEN